MVPGGNHLGPPIHPNSKRHSFLVSLGVTVHEEDLDEDEDENDDAERDGDGLIDDEAEEDNEEDDE